MSPIPTFTPKDWRDRPDITTPLSAAALEDLEARLVAYTQALATYYAPHSKFVAMETQRTTTSAVLEDITGGVVTTHCPADRHILAWCDAMIAADGQCDLALAFNINGVDHEEMIVHLNGATDAGTACLVHRTTDPVAAGNHTIQMRFRRAAGSPKVPHVERLELLVVTLVDASSP